VISVGSVIGGRFRIDQVLGAGGMGVVLGATHLELGHRVAIKLLRDEMAQSPAIVERFLREARAVVSLRTEHVCHVSDVGRLETGAPYIVMEMLEGVDLQRSVALAPLPLTTAVEYVLQACVALAEAHAAGIIHRDLKPANLFVTRRLDGGPLVKVLDFGIAKALTEPGAHLTHQSAMGSPGYMSPEQIQSARDVDVRTDIWALGVTLYQLLAARLPFPGSNATEIAVKVATDPPEPLAIASGLHAVVWKCLEKDPDRRYGSVGALMLALQPFGGPSASHLVRQASQLGGLTSGFAPVPPPVTSPQDYAVAMTQATLGATGTQSGQPVTPRKRRWLLTTLLLVIGGGGAAVGGVMYLRHARPTVLQPAVPPTAPRAVPPAVADAQPVDAVQVVTDASGDPWSAAPTAPADAAAPLDASVPAAAKTVKRRAAEASETAKAMKFQKIVMACQSSATSQLQLLSCMCKQPGAKDTPELVQMCGK
jgi:hypothetical protein